VRRAREIIHAALGDSAYAIAAEETLDDVAEARVASSECRCLVHHMDADVDALIVFGTFAGAAGAGRLHLVAVDERARGRGLGAALLAAASDVLRAEGARFLLAEVADDPPVLGDYWAFLAEQGFREESRVEDLVRDGVALAFLRRELANEDRGG
jgi:ribosomal protein S18 acetylase RimI-like enzyme